MEAKELRIGNWVMGNAPFQVDLNTMFLHFSYMNQTGKQRYEPIPLTEEWLERLGVKPKYNDEFYENEVYQDRWGFHFVIAREYGEHGHAYYIEVDVEFVHDVQNLYFYHNNKKELELNENRV